MTTTLEKLTIPIEQSYEKGYFGYSSEKLGFTFIDEIQWGEASYDFDVTGLWKHEETGTFWMGDDSGCSCPSPFENVRSTDDLIQVHRLQDLVDHLEARNAEGKGDSWRSYDESSNIADMVAKYREAKNG